MKKFFSRFSYPIELYVQKSERSFLAFIIICFLLAMFSSPFPGFAMWVGFLFAAYAAVANDSIQTIGTFIASNQDKKWWVLWIFLGGIFVFTMFYSWSKVDETGITIFQEGENTTSVSIEHSQDAQEIEWLIKNESGDTIFHKTLPYENTYYNEDYGLCFFVNNEGDIHQVTNLIKEKDLDPNARNTYNTYIRMEYEDLSNSATGLHKITESTTLQLFADGQVDGDVSSGRLASKDFEKTPRNFHFLQVAAPIFLLILTRLRMPVSTTFILLTSFSASAAAVGKVLAKSMSGYILAFLIGFIVFVLVAKLAKKHFKGKAHFGWTIAQWITSGTLWSVWLMQDAANIAVYLPRSMSFMTFFGFVAIIFCGLGLLLYYKGGRIQKIVTEKSIVTDVRFATVIDFIYCILLFYFKLHSKVPMSTTWVFIGLLGGRELGMALRRSGVNSISQTFKLIFKDFSFAMIGLFISIAIAVGVNDQLTFTSMINDIPEQFSKGISTFFKKLLGL